MFTSRKAIIALIPVVILLLVLSQPSAAREESPQITIVEAETVPGILTQMVIRWNYSGPHPDDLHFRLLKTTDVAEEPVEVAWLDGSAREYIDRIKPTKPAMSYTLEAVSGDFLLVTVPFTGLVAYSGGFAEFDAHDAPHDGGGVINVEWRLNETADDIKEIRIYRHTEGEDVWNLAGNAEPEAGLFQDTGVENHTPYSYMLRAYGDGVIYSSKPVMQVTCHPAWFDMGKINLLVIMVLILTAVIWYIMIAGKKDMYVRKIAGLQAVEEAVGRATEMGRLVLFIPGIRDLDDVQTIAGLTILGSVAKMTAEYETKIDVPVCTSLVMSNGREVVKEAFMSVGRPDLYHDDIVHYITDEQFGYVAAVDGIMVREKPAACFYMGAFFAESLILAETGNYVGAIQIAGTAMPTQLPFFVAACDYTLIGEELFAASAYLSGDKRMIASLRGQDVGKAMAMVAIMVGAVLTTLVTLTGSSFMVKLCDGFSRLFAMNF